MGGNLPFIKHCSLLVAKEVYANWPLMSCFYEYVSSLDTLLGYREVDVGSPKPCNRFSTVPSALRFATSRAICTAEI